MSRALSQLRTRRQRLAWLLLPALMLRALIPAGFMPFAGPNGPYLGLCPGAGALPPGSSALATHAAHLGHVHHSDEGRHTPGSHHHPACVFSAGATTVFAENPSAALTAPPARAPSERVASLIVLPAILRAQFPRGPPLLA